MQCILLTIMSNLLSWLIFPFPLLLILIICIKFLTSKNIHKFSQYFLAISVFWLFAISTPFIPNLMVLPLENRFKTFTPINSIKNPQFVNILVLGAGSSYDTSYPANNNLFGNTLFRLSEGIRIQRLIPGSIIVTSASGYENEISQAEVTREAAILLGVDSLHIKMQKKPKNTKEEASEYKRLYGASAQLILVTSAIHMPRAIKLFRKAGLNPLPAPTNHLIKKGKHTDFWSWFPSSGNIRKMESAFHEYVGLMLADLED